jgi:4-aminobutyrate aminotransferase-like enzyme/Ser/Thr protein kinase RdoA (MazF antagonist)
MTAPETSRAPSVLEARAPAFSSEDAARIAEEQFGVRGEVTALYSERDQNFRVQTGDSREFVLKIANPAEDPIVVDFQTQALLHIARVDEQLPVPHVIPTREGRPSHHAEGVDGRVSITRLLTFLRGELLDSAPHTEELLCDVGATTARLARALRGFFHPGARHDLFWDLMQAPRLLSRTRHIADAGRRALVEHTLSDFEARLLPALQRMRAQVIHNDVSGQNTLVTREGGGRVSGVIDFGDMIHAPLVADLAVPVAEMIVGKSNPFEVAMEIVAGYHGVEPLRPEEIEIAFDLAKTRKAMALTISAWRVKDHPENTEYITAGVEELAESLEWLAAQSREFTRACLRHACGLSGSPQGAPLGEWLASSASSCEHVLERDLGTAPKRSRAAAHGDAATLRVAVAGGEIGVHGHGAAGACSAEVDDSGEAAERRHLGVDLMLPAGTPIHTALDASVHSVQHAASSAPQLILEHSLTPELRLYSVYLGLDAESLQDLRPGKPLRRGACIGRVAPAGTSAQALPFLHLQLASELLEGRTAPPASCAARQWEIWDSLSPDPNHLLQMPPETFATTEDTEAALRTRRSALLGAALELTYERPVHVVRARGARLIDASGRAYVDAYNNVPQVGHCHPAVVEALARQAARLNTNTRYLFDTVIDYAERLTALLPDPLSVCSFVNSGSEANDVAWRIAKAHTGHDGAIVIRDAYHGITDAVFALSPYETRDADLAPHVATIPAPDGYRGPHRRSERDWGARYAAYVDEAIATLRARGRELAAFFIDPGLMSSGMIDAPAGYLPAVFEKVRAAGGLCVADEVQTGFGRCGTQLWGFEMHGAQPDVVTFGKPIGNGHPIGAVVTSPEMLRSLTDRTDFFSTFGGNTVACAVGLAVLDVLEREGLQENARRVGEYLRQGLRALAERHTRIGDVRGTGLIVGVELVRDRETLEPASSETHAVINRMRELGVLVGRAGQQGNVIKIRPPLVFSEPDADLLLAALDCALASGSRG